MQLENRIIRMHFVLFVRHLCGFSVNRITEKKNCPRYARVTFDTCVLYVLRMTFGRFKDTYALTSIGWSISRTQSRKLKFCFLSYVGSRLWWDVKTILLLYSIICNENFTGNCISSTSHQTRVYSALRWRAFCFLLLFRGVWADNIARSLVATAVHTAAAAAASAASGCDGWVILICIRITHTIGKRQIANELYNVFSIYFALPPSGGYRDMSFVVLYIVYSIYNVYNV